MKDTSFTLEEIGSHFGSLLSQAFAVQITQAKQLKALEADNKALSAEVDRLRIELNRVQSDLLNVGENGAIGEAKERAAD